MTLRVLLFLCIFTNLWALTPEDFFKSNQLYFVKVSDWPSDKESNQDLKDRVEAKNAKIEVFYADEKDQTHCPNTSSNKLIFADRGIQIKTSGNKTKGTPKSSYKITLLNEDGPGIAGMETLNLKSMWNDVSQMREALAWNMFKIVNVPASGHTYARFCLNGKYKGLFSVIENIDKTYLKRRFGKKISGNLYKGNWPAHDLGPANLEDTTEHKYFKTSNKDERTYEIKSYAKPEDESYQDLAELIDAIDKKDFAKLESIFDVQTFLRWAALNQLLGAWDNYWATPANYYLFNNGTAQNPKFTWVPWDYDNTFGITYWSTNWAQADILNWPESTKDYYQGKKTAHLPLITALFSNKKYVTYYVDQMDKMLDTFFNEGWVNTHLKEYWSTIQNAAFNESDFPQGPQHTGRQFTNDQVYWNGIGGKTLNINGSHIPGILDYVKEKHHSARSQIAKIRTKLKN